LTLKVVPNAAVPMKLFRKPTMNLHWRKSTNESKEKTDQKSDVAFEQFLELVSVFKKASRNFIFILVLARQAKNVYVQ
jgi:hypothetical protein